MKQDSDVQLEWRKSSYSGSGGGNCVEVALGQGAVHVRDSKNPQGPALILPSAAWAAFTTHATAGEHS